MRNTQNETVQNAMKVAKRIAITMFCCLPFMLVFAYLLRNILNKDIYQILFFMAFLAIVVVIEEIVSRKAEKRKKLKQEIEPTKDVFK